MIDLNAELVHDTCHFLKFDGEGLEEKTLCRSVKWMIMHLMWHRELWERGLVTAQLDTLQTQLEIVVISSPWNWLAVFTNVYLKLEHEHKDRQEFRNGSLCLRRAKKRQLILLFLICFACTRMHLKEMICMLLASCVVLFYGPLIFLAAKQNSISSFLHSNGKSELLFWWFFRSGLKGSEWFRGFKISRFIQLKGFLSQLNKSNQQAWGSFHSRRWECRAGLRSVSLNTHNGFILLQTSKQIVRRGWSLV